MYSCCKRIRIVCVDVSAPYRTPLTYLFALLGKKEESRNSDSVSTILLAFVARHWIRRTQVPELRSICSGRGSRFKRRGVHCRTEVNPWEMTDNTQKRFVVDGCGRNTRRSRIVVTMVMVRRMMVMAIRRCRGCCLSRGIYTFAVDHCIRSGTIFISFVSVVMMTAARWLVSE